jgi:hypothetical protein
MHDGYEQDGATESQATGVHSTTRAMGSSAQPEAARLDFNLDATLRMAQYAHAQSLSCHKLGAIFSIRQGHFFGFF